MSISDILANAAAIVTVFGGATALIRFIRFRNSPQASKFSPPPPPKPRPGPPVPRPPIQPLTKNPSDGISGEWLSEGNSCDVELFLTAQPGFGSYRQMQISGIAEHWSCGSVTITGKAYGKIRYKKGVGVIDGGARVHLKLTPVLKSTIAYVKLDLILLQGKMRGNETHFERGGLFNQKTDTYPLTVLWTGH